MQNYVGIGTLITLHVHSNLLAQKWPPGVSDSTPYEELKLWLILKEIVFLKNVIWNIIPPKLLFRTIPCSQPRYPNLHHVMFIHHCEKLKQKTQWMVHARKTELQAHITFWTNTDIGCCTLHICITVSTATSNETRK